MASMKGRILDLLGGAMLQTVTVDAIEAPDPAFRIVTLTGLADARYTPGCKVQVLLPDRSVRTYTPVGWGATTRLVVHRHDPQSPAGRWIDGLAVGDPVRFTPPRKALTLPDGPVALLGDATSIATAAAYTLAAPGTVTARFWMSEDPRATLDALGLSAATVHAEVAGITTDLSGVVGVTGSGAFVKQARAQLRAQGATVRVKAYWIAGRTGLD